MMNTEVLVFVWEKRKLNLTANLFTLITVLTRINTSDIC